MKTRLSRHLQHYSSILLATLMANGGCGVEVGNPHGTKGGAGSTTAGTISVALADAPIDSVKHVYFNLKSLSAVAGDGTTYALTLSTTGKVDALDLQNGKSLALATGQSLPPGDYAATLLELDADNPASVVDSTGVETALPFANGSHEIYIPQAFTVTSGVDLDLIMHVDLRASLTQLTDAHGGHKGFQFGPQASLLPRNVEAIIVGAVADTTLVEVCAYRQHNADYIPGSHLPNGVPGGEDGPGGGSQPPPPPPPDSASARAPHTFDPDDTVQQLDDQATCPNAFATAAISNGGFSLHHLWPGSYKLRFFKADGTHVDSDPSVVAVGPGETATATLATTTAAAVK